MEALVGLLRGQQLADHTSVEIYLRKHEGFVLSLSRIDYKALNTEYCKNNLSLLKNKYTKQFVS